MVDVRGFSEFAGNEEPTSVAAFVSAATNHTLTIVSDCRQLADSIIKPLGDGLLFILNVESASQATMAHTAEVMLDELRRVSETFGHYVALNRPAGLSSAPSRLGIGVAFGPLIRLSGRSSQPPVAFDDYVGHTINLAARLQELARSGGCVVHESVYDKILKHDPGTRAAFHQVFGEKVEVRLRNIGGPEDTVVYATADIPSEYLKSKTDEKLLEEFARKAMTALQDTFAVHRPKGSQFWRLPEATRFLLFKRDGDVFRETVPYMIGQQIHFTNEVSLRIKDMQKDSCPISEAIVTGKPVVVAYTTRYDECNPDDLNNEYWRQTMERFPAAPIDVLRGLAMHPASILAIPLHDRRSGDVAAVAAFDHSETNVFSKAIAAEMAIKLPLLYDQLFGTEDSGGPVREVVF